MVFLIREDTVSEAKKVICEQCDLVLEIPECQGVKVGVCPRCGSVVHHYHPSPVIYSLCFAISALAMIISTDFLPFLTINFSGLSNSMMLLDYVSILFDKDLGLVSLLIMMFMHFFPIVALFIIIICDCCYLKHKKSRFIALLLKFYVFCKDWSMVDVFVVGVLVSLIKLVNLVDVVYEFGFWSYILFALLFILSVSRFHVHVMWEYFFPQSPIERNIVSGVTAYNQGFTNCHVCDEIVDIKKSSVCPRCGADVVKIHERSIQKCLAFLIAAVAIYIPANLYPMMITFYMGSGEESTILEGVIVLWELKSYFVSMVIFIASVCIPILKILVLFYLCYVYLSFKRAKKKKLLGILFRVVEFIGKWSMVDVFVVAIMVSIVRMGNIMIIDPGFALVSFGAVVILTILAAKQFNPKLLWINLNRNQNNGE